MEESEVQYNHTIKHHDDTVEKMFHIYDELVKATNKLIKQTYIRHEKNIQRLEREIHANDNMNLVLHQLLIRTIKYAQHYVHIPNFDSN